LRKRILNRDIFIITFLLTLTINLNNMRKLILACMLAIFATSGWAQETFPRNDVKDQRENAYAFTNATIVADFQTVINNGLMLIRDGKIEYVGNIKTIPAGYTTIDLSGKRIYPSLIDVYTNYGVPKAERARRDRNSPEQINSKTDGAYNANQAIKSDYSAAENFTLDAKKAKELRELGFGAANTFKADGLARGTSAFVTLGEDSDNNVLLNEHAAAHYSLTKGSSTQAYPVSQMGFVALLRQTYLDAKWYGSHNPRPFKDQTLEHWISSQSLPQIFDTQNYLAALRADRVGDEFGVQYIIKGSGDEYKRLNLIKATGASMIIPLDFPDANDVEDPIATLDVSLADMKHWELAPTNLGRLRGAGVDIAITSAGLKKTSEFWPNLRKAIKHGLSEEDALKALTYTPASMVRGDGSIGSLAKGKLANFIITSDNLFSEKNIIHENWVQGNRFILKSLDVVDNSGAYKLTVDNTSYNVEITGEPGKQKGKIIVNDTTKSDLSTKFKAETVVASFKPKGEDGLIRLSGWKVDNGWKGNGQVADGKWVNWEMSRTGDLDSKKKGDKSKKKETGDDKLGDVIYPFVAHGTTTLPQQQTILIKNTTVWTSDKEGVLEGTDVLLKDGKIAKIGKNLTESGAIEVDGSGKHLTPGIIDEHSHVGGGGNDVASNSGMVRIGDQINPDQITIYQALSGGVVALQVLHGSANPIGGQSALIKLRWGESPENLKIAGADEYIKFALGENVKRSRSQNSIRYPQTRMGVEQVYMDAFSSAKEYEKKWQAYNSLSKKEKPKAIAPRKDLADEAMLEIINKERFITCHSYVQSEINMLMNVADKFDFKVNTFTHILEGYKVADRMKEHGVAASTFSDWWAYKWEVRYAIPYNAAIMHNAGLLVAINSDDSNSGRRLNQEAAKSVKYGGMSEEDVLNMVTINPAKMLHLDDQMGSITIGKDADVVLWSGHPLSVYSRAEKTIVDGKVYYDLEKDKANREYIATERARLIQKMKGAKKSGAPTRKGGSRQIMEFHCEDEIQTSNFY
jgi:imidazolonepropionase-like amidohydrolase